MNDLLNFLKSNNFDKRVNKLKNKLQNKSIIIYGAGKLFKTIMDNYDLSELDIIGVCDKSFSVIDESMEIYNYRKISLNNLPMFDYDYILIAAKNYIQIKNDLSSIVNVRKMIPIVDSFVWFDIIKSTNLNERYITILGKTFTIPVLPSEKVLAYLQRENPERNKKLFSPRNLYTQMANIAAESSARYVMKNMFTTPAFENRIQLISYALSQVEVEGKYLEFGVYKGESINHIASQEPNKTIYGFDSFEGLPESWTSNHPKGHFKINGLPKVKKNVKLIKGWFDSTIPQFIKEENEFKIAFIHSDSDLYSSTKTMFELLSNNIQSGTVIVFDEYFNYPNWEEGEFKAFQEFIKQNNLSYKYLGYTYTASQVAVQIFKA